MGINSARYTDRRKEEGPEESIKDWIERLDWVRQEAETQLRWMGQIDAESTPPGGRSILGHWFDLARLQNRRYLPLFRSFLSNHKHPDVPTASECLESSREESAPADPALPAEVADDRRSLIALLKSTSKEQWNWLLDGDNPSNPSPFLDLLNEVKEQDRLILREMSLQLLDRHREELSQRELRQRMPSREES